MGSSPITAPGSSSRSGGASRPLARSFPSSSPLADAAILRDLEEEEVEHLAVIDSDSDDDSSGESTIRPSNYSLSDGYRRPSFIASGPRSTVVAALSLPEHGYLSKREREAARNEERSLLRDNHILPPKHPQSQDEESFGARLKKTISAPALKLTRTRSNGEESTSPLDAPGDGGPSESSPLLRDPMLPYGGEATSKNIQLKWEEAVMSGNIRTSWKRETKVLSRYSAPLVLTFLLQYSLTMASIFTVGHIGKIELGAVSLASSTY